jgi:acyl-coenzyme A synthetase/AMP-(fatty) acid ligase
LPDLILSLQGFQVAPAELEGLLLLHPKVNAAAVIGIYDKSQATELPRAYVEIKGGRQSKEQEDAIAKEITDFFKKKTSAQKQLRGGVRFLDKVPASPSGKLLRKDLRALVKKEEEEESRPSAKL